MQIIHCMINFRRGMILDKIFWEVAHLMCHTSSISQAVLNMFSAIYRSFCSFFFFHPEPQVQLIEVVTSNTYVCVRVCVVFSTAGYIGARAGGEGNRREGSRMESEE